MIFDKLFTKKEYSDEFLKFHEAFPKEHIPETQFLNVNGTEYHQQGLAKLELGRNYVELEHEKGNRHDRNAVRVMGDGRKIGYIPKTVSEKYRRYVEYDLIDYAYADVTEKKVKDLDNDDMPVTSFVRSATINIKLKKYKEG